MSFKQLAMKGLHLAKVHAPEIMIGASIVAGGAALYFTVRGTLKLNDVLDDHDERTGNLKAELKELKADENASPDETKLVKKELAKEYLKTGGKLALTYAPAAALAVSSAVLSISAHGIMQKRVATALAAVESVSGAFAAYRQRVKDRFGETVENEILSGKKVEQIEEEVTDEKGKTKKVVKENVTIDGNISPYAREFSANTTDEFWCTVSNDGSGRSYNQEYLESNEQAFDLKLRLNGFVFLNDVYKILGFEETPEGQLVGWRLNGDGDGCVKFNIQKVFEGDDENLDVWMLDFNVDGIIFDKI